MKNQDLNVITVWCKLAELSEKSYDAFAMCVGGMWFMGR